MAIAVLSGPAPRHELEPHADHVVDTIADLPALLRRLRG
jgi:phosphoglycolate phosphatase-like HAD superfamily hydrolase